ncbi:3-isopropylmalate dehydratase small subunit [Aliihoeflea aestuarii]|jgi:3-isopropylmalate/(R)-2-methylmalate dehydratase small subunit|uniref:3-isopropylmalate dehydratase small subunit n=1 Tax=Aliihoeflea aestuarii TaxID=453840 RepID=UPI002094C4B9|nr:3-isopropylmalate dehydratase small subunit [Aliihoeflea aestuarii]MCO6392671.1 3-isopropylmalate dehydratase small subunit [Aliihoeflea aestuarii]
MKPFVAHEGQAVVLPVANVDTDQIIPARFLRKPRSAGYGNFLLHDLRFDANGRSVADFPLNRAEAPSFLIAGSNFGCGSSREGAVYALVDYGFRAVIAPRIADIFRNNSVRNGLVPIELPDDEYDRLAQAVEADPAREMKVDLQTCTLSHPALAPISFVIDEGSRKRLLKGLDDIAETAERFGAIEDFAASYRKDRPWTWPASPDKEAR